MKPSISIFWFRRDLRLHDNAALYHALKGIYKVQPVFIYDTEILDELADKYDKRVEFIHSALQQIQKELEKKGVTLDVRKGRPQDIFQLLINDYNVKEVFTNRDYEPYARQRDTEIEQLLSENGIVFHSFKDHVIFEKNEVLKNDETPYTIFTPYSRKWRSLLTEYDLKSYETRKYFGNFFKQPVLSLPALNDLGFKPSGTVFPANEWNGAVIRNYKDQRDILSIKGTSRLSVHLRFGTTSIRTLAAEAGGLNDTFLNELIWRDFYQMILWHFPSVVTSSFKPKYEKISWRNNPSEFLTWCEGRTGYPIVDAGMRELNETGFMHNRVRMIVASFLVKHLLIDWRWGEAYFAKKLLDFDLASNNGGWQWAAGSGCDAAPYFRVFNPWLQTNKFDPQHIYIRKWVPEFEELTYPVPIIDHETARKRCLLVYGEALKK